MEIDLEGYKIKSKELKKDYDEAIMKLSLATKARNIVEQM
jgi:hypothetical protein